MGRPIPPYTRPPNTHTKPKKKKKKKKKPRNFSRSIDQNERNSKYDSHDKDKILGAHQMAQ